MSPRVQVRTISRSSETISAAEAVSVNSSRRSLATAPPQEARYANSTATVRTYRTTWDTTPRAPLASTAPLLEAKLKLAASPTSLDEWQT